MKKPQVLVHIKILACTYYVWVLSSIAYDLVASNYF